MVLDSFKRNKEFEIT
jgi:hypothetical protein